MARKKPHEDHINHEAWAIPYGDLVTLLLAFFVVLYAISSINEGKYRVMSDAMSQAFGGPPKSLKPIQVGQHRQRGSNSDQSISLNKSEQVDQSIGGTTRDLSHPSNIQSKLVSKLPPRPGGGRLHEARTQAEKVARIQLIRMGEEIAQALKQLIDADMVKVRNKEFWLELEVRSDILFRSGQADLVSQAYATIDLIAQVLAQFPNGMRIEGHTDDQPISTQRFPSNWELSASRAASVVRRLIESGIEPRRLTIVGLGELWPIADNQTAEGRNENRRVTIVVLGTSEMADKLPDLRTPGPAPQVLPGSETITMAPHSLAQNLPDGGA